MGLTSCRRRKPAAAEPEPAWMRQWREEGYREMSLADAAADLNSSAGSSRVRFAPDGTMWERRP